MSIPLTSIYLNTAKLKHGLQTRQEICQQLEKLGKQFDLEFSAEPAVETTLTESGSFDHKAKHLKFEHYIIVEQRVKEYNSDSAFDFSAGTGKAFKRTMELVPKKPDSCIFKDGYHGWGLLTAPASEIKKGKGAEFRGWTWDVTVIDGPIEEGSVIDGCFEPRRPGTRLQVSEVAGAKAIITV